MKKITIVILTMLAFTFSQAQNYCNSFEDASLSTAANRENAFNLLNGPGQPLVGWIPVNGSASIYTNTLLPCAGTTWGTQFALLGACSSTTSEGVAYNYIFDPTHLYSVTFNYKQCDNTAAVKIDVIATTGLVSNNVGGCSAPPATPAGSTTVFTSTATTTWQAASFPISGVTATQLWFRVSITTNPGTAALFFFDNFCITDLTTGAPCGSNDFWCQGNGCTPNSTNSDFISSSERIGQLRSGYWGSSAATDPSGNMNVWTAIGNAAVGSAPNNSNLYGLSVGSNSDKAFFGLRNHGSDLNDAVIGWGDNDKTNPDGSSDRLIFEFHKDDGKCGTSTGKEVATMLPNGNVGIGVAAPGACLHINNTNPQDGYALFVNYTVTNQVGNAVGIVSETFGSGNNNNTAGQFDAYNGKKFNYGVIGTGQKGDRAYGGYFLASNGGTNIGVYANDGSYGGGTPGPGAANASNCAAYIDGDAYITATYGASDEKLKSNVKDFDGALDKLRKLQTKTYTFNTEKFKNSMNLPTESQIGIMAQNLQSVFPTLVKQKTAPSHLDPTTKEPLGSATDFLAVNYTGLIPVLVQAVNELNTKVEENVKLKADLDNTNAKVEALQKQLDDICNGGCAALKNGNSNDASLDNKLMQNVPNPFSQQTTIGYVLNTGTIAYININALDGSQVKHLELAAKGQGSVTINGNDLNSGTYTYTLYVDGKVVDTKLMVIAASK